MDRLELSTYLGANLDPVAAWLADAVSTDLSIDLRFDATLSTEQRLQRIINGSVHVTWMCGLLSAQMIHSEAMAAGIVAAPVFVGETEPVYRSVVIVAADSGFLSLGDLAGARLVINQTGSWSGHHALRARLKQLGLGESFFETVIESGSHKASVQEVLAGGADCAAIDHTIWSNLVEGSVGTGRLRVIGLTDDWPSPPLALAHSLAEPLRGAIETSLVRVTAGQALRNEIRRHGVERLVPVGGGAYDPLRAAVADGLGEDLRPTSSR